jgi:hypothetical protein
MSVLPITNVINVTITNTPQGLTEKNINNIALFSTEVPNNIDDYRSYVNASQVAEDYGTDSVTAQMANAVFAQTPNIRTGGGQLTIIPLQSAVSATQGYFATTNLAPNVNDFITVSNGDIRFVVDGVNNDLTGLNFTNANTLDDIATIIGKKLQNVITETKETLGYFTTADIAANVANIILVADGDLRVTIDGVNNDLTNLDFTSATTLADIAAILQLRLNDANVSVVGNTIVFASKTKGGDSSVVVSQLPAGAGTDLSGATYFDTGSGVATVGTEYIIFTSKIVGASSSVDIVQLPGGVGTDLSGATYLNVASGVATVGVNSSGETIQDAITRTEGTVFYAGVMTDLEMEDAVINPLADFIQARDMIFVHHFSSTGSIAGVITTIKDASNTKTRALLYTVSPQEANLMKAAYVGRGFSVNTNGTNTAFTMHLKALNTINSDDGINQTILNQAITAGADMYVSIEGLPSTYSVGGNDFFDNVYMNLALKFALETAGFNYLKQTNTKVPQTESGMSGLKSAYNVVNERFVNNNFIAPGEWTSSETFGDPEIFKQNIREVGYYTYSIPISQQSASEREQRKAPLVQIAIKRSGAIHSSDVLVIIND